MKAKQKRKSPVRKPAKKTVARKRAPIKKRVSYTTVKDYVIYINHNGKRFYFDGKQLDDVKANAKGYRSQNVTFKRDAQKVADATGKAVYGDTRSRKVKKKR